jgi:NADH:ubiquinone oxidoreductase subunit E
MGSACHQLGGYRMIPAIERLIARHHLQERIVLKGAFCLESCERGCSMKFGDQVISGLTDENLEERFRRELLPLIHRD